MGWFGAIPLIVGVVVAGMSLAIDASRVKELYFYLIFLVAFRVLGTIAILIGLHWVLGYTAIELHGDRLRVAAKVFGIGWWRSRPVRQITRVEAVRTPGEHNGQPATSGVLATLAKLEACGEGRRRFLLASSYDLRILSPLAADLNRRLKARSGR